MKPPAPHTSAAFPAIGFEDISVYLSVWLTDSSDVLAKAHRVRLHTARASRAGIWPRYRPSGETITRSDAKTEQRANSALQFYAAGASAER